MFPENPMNNIEYIQHDCIFNHMLEDSSFYASKDFFPRGVDIVEPYRSEAPFRMRCLSMYPESRREGQERGVEIVEMMNERIEKESRIYGKAHRLQICYLVITHGFFVDETAHIFDYLEKNPKSIPLDKFYPVPEN